MSCRRIMRWVLQHGVADVPSEWSDHIAGCAKCREFIANIHALDAALAKSDVPDPGKEYWDAFAPSVARRIDEFQTAQERATVPARGRWTWARRWAPALGVAVLAVLIGRELSRDYTNKPAIMDRDLPVQAQKASAPSAADEVIAEKAPATTHSDLVDHSQESDAGVADVTQRQVPQHPPVRESAKLSAQPSQKEEAEPDAPADLPGNVANELDIGSLEAADIPEMASTRAPQIVDQQDETDVWPDRRVQTLGQLGQDASGQPTIDDVRLSEQGSPVLADRQAWGAMRAESSAAPSPLERLEGRQAFRSATLPDSQSPTEAMRRFDELTGLRKQIADLEAVTADKRSADQTRELCAMWYRAGQITLDPAELDRAIERMGIYIVDLDESLRPEWTDKKSQLVSRRASFNR